MKLGRYVTVDDGGNYVTERSHKDKKNNNNSSQRELGPPVAIYRRLSNCGPCPCAHNTFPSQGASYRVKIWKMSNLDLEPR